MQRWWNKAVVPPPTIARGTVSVALLLCAVVLSACAASDGAPPPGREPVVGGPCEGCELVFEGLPAEPGSSARIAPPDEPGEALRIEGRVVREDGAPAPGTIVYVYHTNAAGIYPTDGPGATRHGRLRGWARADADGRYRFDTVRPGGYPGTDTPEHVHMHVIEPGRCTYYVDDVLFEDDPRLTPEARAQYELGRGGSGVAAPRRDAGGAWLVERDVVLGRNIPGYPARTDPQR